MYRYFICFELREGGFFNTEVHLAGKIRGMPDIEEITRRAEKELGVKENTVNIINFQLFD